MLTDLPYSLRSAFLTVALAAASAASAGLPLPFHSSLDTPDEFENWTTYDVDGNWDDEHGTWCLSTSDMGGIAAGSWGNDPNRNDVDNWLVSPAIALNAGTEYVLKFKYYTAYYVDENLEVYISRDPNPESEHTLLDKSVLRNYYGGTKTISISPLAEAGDYYISFRNVDYGGHGLVIFVKDVDLDVVTEGSLEGTVTEWQSGSKIPVEGMTVHISGPKEYDAVTDAQGHYSFPAVRSGDYTVTHFKHGYEDENYPYTLTVDAGTAANYDFSVYRMSTTKVTGTVKDKAGTAVSGAIVTLSGYDTFSATVAEDGSFEVPGVLLYKGSYYDAPYTLTVTKNGFADLSEEVSVRNDYYTGSYDAGALVLTYKALAPMKPAATEGKIIWSRPVDTRLHSYDNGSPSDEPLGFENAVDNILGVLFPGPATVYGVDFYRKSAADAATPPEKVNVWIFPLNADGDPVNTLAGGLNDVIAPLDTWTSVELHIPLDMPNGYMVALNTQGYLSIGRDDNPEPVAPHTQLYSNSFSGGYRYFDEIDWPGALMIRARSEIKEETSYELQMAYNVYRLLDENRDVRDTWTSVAKDVTSFEAVDKDFASLPRGSYRYAVEAVYPVDELVSDPAMTYTFFVDQFTDVEVSVTADSDPADAAGARLTLVSADKTKTYPATVGDDGKAVFVHVWKDTYTLSATQPGFTCAATTVDLNDQPEYALSLALTQVLAPVDNIDAEVRTDGVLVSWDLFSDIADNFDGPEYADFEINPAGSIGWSYVDGDAHATYGFGGSTFPGMRSPMAAIIMNGTAVQPATSISTGRSGDRSLAFFAASPDQLDAGMQLNTSDDYLISPRLDFHKPFTLSLHAMSYESIEGRLERIVAGYSTTTPDIENFIWDEAGLQDVPYREWTEFSWTFPAEARYVALNSRSDDVFLLLVDDIALGTGIKHSGLETAHGAFLGYTYSIDGGEPVSTAASSQLFTDLVSGSHTVSVCKVYNGGSSAPLDITFDTTDGISDIAAEGAGSISISLDAAAVLHISGNFEAATVWTPAGAAVRTVTAAATDLSSLAPGVYLVSAQGPDGHAAARIVIK